MGGGGSSSNKTYNNVDFKPTTTIDFDVEALADAIREGNIANEKIGLLGLSLEEQKNKIEEQKNAIEGIKVQNLLNISEDAKKGLKILGFCAFGYLIFKNKEVKKWIIKK